MAVGYKSYAGGRQFQILQDLTLRRATWTYIAGSLGGPINSAASGFLFITGSTNNQQILIVDSIFHSGAFPTDDCFNHSRIFNPPITIKSGDFIVASVYNSPGLYTTSLPAGTRNSVNLYCYY